MSDLWTVDEVLALLGTSKKQVVITEDDLPRIVDILNGEDEAHTLDEIALAAMQGLLASGQFSEAGGARSAGVLAWTDAVPGFIQGKNTFLAMASTLMATTAATVIVPPDAPVSI